MKKITASLVLIFILCGSFNISCSPIIQEKTVHMKEQDLQPFDSPVMVTATAIPTPEVTCTIAPTSTPAPTNTPVPSIQFKNGSIPIDASEITLVIESGETSLFDELPELSACHLEGSSCYDEISKYASLHPNIIITYDVRIVDSSYSLDTASIQVNGSKWKTSDILNAFKWLPNLKTLDLDGTELSVSDCEELQDVLVDSVVNYKIIIGSTSIPYDIDSLDLNTAHSITIDALISAIPFLPNLSFVSVPKNDSVTLEDVGRLQHSKSGLIVDYPVTIYGKTFSTADKYIVLSKKRIKVKQLDELRSIMPYMTNCEKVIMEDCGLSDEVMDELRTELAPYTEIVWRIRCGPYSCRTDAIMIKFSGKSTVLTDTKTSALKYCHDVVYLDLGHNHLRHIDFVKEMPYLEVCIIAVNYLVDITPIQYCTKLEYCEFLSNVSIDVTPLAACTNLKHLNISFCNVTDITPLYGLINLERLWISRNHIPADQITTITELLPNAEINTTSHNPTGEGWREHPRYELLREQFQYDSSRIRSCYIMDGQIVYDDTK